MSDGPVKRVTLWVRDAERSLRIYRDALGLSVLEDKRLSGVGIARMIGLQSASLRIVHLATPGATHGWVGLYEIADDAPSAVAALPDPGGFPRYGQATVVVDIEAIRAAGGGAHSMQQVVAKLRATPGVRFITEPSEYIKTTPSEAMRAGRYGEMIFFDPDNIAVSLIDYAPL